MERRGREGGRKKVRKGGREKGREKGREGGTGNKLKSVLNKFMAYSHLLA